LFVVCDNNYRKYYVNYGRTRFRVLRNEISLLIKKWYRGSFFDRKFIREIKKDCPFIYFPLHLQPERSTLYATPFYVNQIEVITNIAKSLPVKYKLYVKEHPTQVLNGWRSISFYNKILNLPNVELLHPSLSNDELIRHCSLVITIAGSSGLEAAFYGKPSVVFGDVIYSDLPSVQKVQNIEELPQIIKESLKKTVEFSDIKKYVNYVKKNSFEFDLIGLNIRSHDRFYYGGFLFDVETPMPEVFAFLEENKSVFKKMASEYLKKIILYRKYIKNKSNSPNLTK